MQIPADRIARHVQRVPRRDGVYLDILPGEVVALIGRSGCGKSTLLRCISWLDEPDEGLVELEGRPFGREVTPGGVVRRHSPRQVAAMRPRLGFVFQALNLWPHMTALENVVPSVDLVGTPETVAAKMDEVMQEVGGDGFLIALPNVSRKSVCEVTEGLVPALQRRGLVRKKYEHTQFRDNLLAF